VTEIRYTLHGRPATWQRTNVVNGRPTTDKRQRESKAAHRWAAVAALRKAGHRTGQFKGDFEVEVIGYWPDGVVGDADRLTSLVMDALEGVVYRTDRQVKRQVGEVHVDRDNPRTEVVVRRREGAGA
jgi:Holliday junction resolvase RusA-like endonuclease